MFNKPLALLKKSFNFVAKKVTPVKSPKKIEKPKSLAEIQDDLVREAMERKFKHNEHRRLMSQQVRVKKWRRGSGIKNGLHPNHYRRRQQKIEEHRLRKLNALRTQPVSA